MVYRAERVDKNQDYQLRDPNCGCKTCQGFLNPELSRQKRRERNNGPYIQKYAGPVIFATLLIGVAAASSYFFNNSHENSRKTDSGIERKVK